MGPPRAETRTREAPVARATGLEAAREQMLAAVDRPSLGATGGAAGSAGGVGGASGGAAGSTGGSAGAVAVDGGDAGSKVEEPDAAPRCTPPANPNDAKACFVLSAEQVSLGTTSDLDGRGTLIVQVFDTEKPASTAQPLKEVTLPPSSSSGELGVYSLPEIDIDGLPETVYVRILFVDNPAWFAKGSGFLYGMFVGGFNLNFGVLPPPPLRAVTLVKGQAKHVPETLTALRRFTTEVVLDFDPGEGPVADDGKGPLNVGVFQTRTAINAPAVGGVEFPCQDVTRGPIPVTGYFYGIGGGDFYFGSQLDDFNQQNVPSAGGIVSLDLNDGLLPASQKLTVAADQYSVSAPQIRLNAVIPGFQGLPPYSCSSGAPVDAGHD